MSEKGQSEESAFGHIVRESIQYPGQTTLESCLVLKKSSDS